MKILLLTTFLYSVCAFAGEPVRKWADTQGRTIRAQFIHASADHVTLRMGEKEFPLPLEILSKADQDYVRKVSTYYKKNQNRPVNVGGLQAKLIEMEEIRKAEKEACAQKIMLLNNRIEELVEKNSKEAQKHKDLLNKLVNEQKKVVKDLQNEIRQADAEGYKRGINEMTSKLAQLSSTGTVPDGPSNSVSEKLKIIEIPGVHFFQSPLSDAMMELQRLSKQFDLSETNPSKKGVNIIISKTLSEEPKLNIKLNAMPLGNMIEFISEMIGWSYIIQSDAVIFKPYEIVTEKFELDGGLIKKMANALDPENNKKRDPFAARSVQPFKVGDHNSIVSAFFGFINIQFNEKMGYGFTVSEGEISITHSRLHMDRIIESFELLK